LIEKHLNLTPLLLVIQVMQDSTSPVLTHSAFMSGLAVSMSATSNREPSCDNLPPSQPRSPKSIAWSLVRVVPVAQANLLAGQALLNTANAHSKMSQELSPRARLQPRLAPVGEGAITPARSARLTSAPSNYHTHPAATLGKNSKNASSSSNGQANNNVTPCLNCQTTVCHIRSIAV
jgi:hypothetical protein